MFLKFGIAFISFRIRFLRNSVISLISFCLLLSIISNKVSNLWSLEKFAKNKLL